MAHHPDMPIGIEVPTLLDVLPHAIYAPGCHVQDDDPTLLPAAVEAAGAAELCVVVVGDHPGLFGRGTSGEGCDAEDLALPGLQDELVEAVIETGTPVVLVVVSGRPYALGRYVGRVAAIVQAFLPGEEGAAAIAGVLTGAVMPTRQAPRAGAQASPARSRTRTCTRCSAAAAAASRTSTPTRRSRSATGSPTRRSPTTASR